MKTQRRNAKHDRYKILQCLCFRSQLCKYIQKNLQKNEKNDVAGDMRKLVIGLTGVRGLRKMS